MKELKEKDLQVGDILIFENEDFSMVELLEKFKEDYKEDDPKKRIHAAFYLLLYLIPWFDPGKEDKNYKNIYHAAIWGNVNIYRGENKEPVNENRIVQAGTHGIGQASLGSTLSGKGVKNIYVYRRKDLPENFHDKVNKSIWSFYDDTSIPYSYETAWLLAVICSMRYSDGAIYEMLKSKMGEWAAKKMVEVILELINDYNNSHEKEMVACSTLVAMIYKKAGFELEIEPFVENPSIELPADLQLKPEYFHKSNASVTSINDSIMKVKETVVTPRQLAESPDVELVGILPRIEKEKA